MKLLPLPLLFFDLQVDGYKFYSTIYYKELNTIRNQKIINHTLKLVIELIGHEFKESIRGNGSNLHKGIKKIIQQCKTQSAYSPSVKEVKSLLSSLSTLTIFSDKKLEKVLCPFSSGTILAAISEIILTSKSINDKYNAEVTKTGLNPKEYVNVFIPKYYSLLARSLHDLNEIEKRKKVRYDWHKKKLAKTLKELDSINK